MNWAVPASAPTLLVSDTGRVVRMASSRRKGRAWQTFEQLELKPRKIGAGYLAINCKIENKKLNCYLHRLVAEAFLGINPEKREVNHIDGDKTNNNLSNLEWVTHSENHRHAVRAGISGAAVLTTDNVREIRKSLQDGDTFKAIAQRHGVTASAINHIKSGRSWYWLS